MMLNETGRRAFFRRVLQHRPKTVNGAQSAVLESLADGACLLTFQQSHLVVEFRLRKRHSAAADRAFAKLHADRTALARRMRVTLRWDTANYTVAATYPGSMSWAQLHQSRARTQRGDVVQGAAWSKRSIARAEATNWASTTQDLFIDHIVKDFRSDDPAPADAATGLFGRPGTPTKSAASPSKTLGAKRSTPKVPQQQVASHQATVKLPPLTANLAPQGHTGSRPHRGPGDYERRVRALELAHSGHSSRQRTSTMTRNQRSREARTLVIERSSGRCENPECGNPDFEEHTPAGTPSSKSTTSMT